MFSFGVVFFSTVIYSAVYYYFFVLLWIITWFLFLILFLTVPNIKQKCFFFFINLLYFAVWGFWFDIDGVIMVVLLTEFMLLVIFLLVYTQIYTKLKVQRNKLFYSYVVPMLVPFIWFIKPKFWVFNWVDFYISTVSFLNGDFFTFYSFFFLKFPIILCLITITLGVFSVVFIFFFLNLKSALNTTVKSKKMIYFLRRQTLLKQANFNSFLRSFKL